MDFTVKQGCIENVKMGCPRARSNTFHATIRRALGQALKWRLVPRNVATLVDPPRVQRREIEPLDPSDARLLLAAVRDNRLEALYSVESSLSH